jgi:hypothetical protein
MEGLFHKNTGHDYLVSTHQTGDTFKLATECSADFYNKCFRKNIFAEHVSREHTSFFLIYIPASY